MSIFTKSPKTFLLSTMLLTALVTASILITPTHATAQSIENLGTLGGSASYAYGVNANGSVVIGQAENVFAGEAFRWTQGTGMVSLGTLGGFNSYAFGINADGSVVVGAAENASYNYEAFRWTQGSGMIGLGTLGGFFSYAQGVNADGSVVVGAAVNVSSDFEAFRWTQGSGMIGLGTLGGDISRAWGANGDGSVVIGDAENALGNSEAFRWTQGSGMIGLGTLGGDSSFAYDVNADGAVVVGQAENASLNNEAFRWTQATGMLSLGTLGGFTSFARGVNADGSVVVGEAENASLNNEAFRWTAGTGIQSLHQILNDAGVDLTSWNLQVDSSAYGVSADGNVLVGYTDHDDGYRAFIFTMAAGGGIATPEQIAQDTQPIAQNITSTQYHMTRSSDNGLMIARNALPLYLKNSTMGSIIGGTSSYGRSDAPSFGNSVDSFANLSPAAGQPMLRNRKALFAFGTGGIGQENNYSNQGYNGVSGILFELGHSFSVGVGASGSYNNFETRLGGDTRTSAFGGTILGSYESQDTPWRAYASAGVIGIDARFNRNYVNGGGVDTSRGNTDGFGYGVSGRVGYEKPINEEFGFMPYGELQYAHTKLNAYTETGGGFPATIGEQESDTIVSKFGGELSYKASPDTTWRFRGAWAHQYGDTATDVNVTVAGIGQNIAGVGGDRDWMEIGTSIHHNATDRLLLTGDITGRTGERSEPAIAGTVGVIWYLN